MTLLMIIIEIHSSTDYGDKRTFHNRPMLEMCFRYSVSNFTNSYVGISISLEESLIYIGQTGRRVQLNVKIHERKGKRCPTQVQGWKLNTKIIPGLSS